MLFSPIKIGSTMIKNRVVVTAHLTNFGKQPENIINDKYISYLERRAKGGVGLIITEVTGVHPSTHPLSGNTFVYDEKCIPRYEKLARSLHKYDCKGMVQLWHGGRQSHSGFNRMHVISPSAIPCPLNRQVPKEMESEDIREMIDAYVKSAINVQKAGMDGVEVHGAHGYLICQFLSGFSNKRKDEYGGDLDNRMRFAREIIEGIRAECGKDFIVGFRISADEFVEGGINLDEAKEIVKKIEGAGNVDYISVSAGNYATTPIIVGNASYPIGWLVPYSSAIKSVTDLPVIAVQRINDPQFAEKVLADGHADLVGICRGNIADPDFVNKAREGREDEIRKCMGCLQGCTSRIFQQFEMSCVQNPVVGFEQELDEISQAKKKKTIIVVGGGPAGMEFARVANLRGHQVKLYEKESHLGGQINLITNVKSREEFGEVKRYREVMLKKQGVVITLGKEIDEAFVLAENPDAVVLATGSRAHIPPFDGNNNKNVIDCMDVLKRLPNVGKRVVIVGDDTFRKATDVAEYLCSNGAEYVEIVTKYPFVGLEIDFINLTDVYQKLYTAGVKFTPNTIMTAYDGRNVTVKNAYSGREDTIQGIDAVIIASWNKANDELYTALKGKVKELYRVGDCLAPRTAMDAIYDAYKLAREI